MDIAKDLRCLVCQNETIAGSHADLAIDLRKQIKSQLEAGKSRTEIMQYMVDRYGDFVLYNPPMKTTTILLWLGPFLLMLIGLISLRKFSKSSSTSPAATNYSAEDLSKARAILENKKD
jgi:cytochrome c-type biogenesis protein CcmH